jgi:hypothetical protein
LLAAFFILAGEISRGEEINKMGRAEVGESKKSRIVS